MLEIVEIEEQLKKDVLLLQHDKKLVEKILNVIDSKEDHNRVKEGFFNWINAKYIELLENLSLLTDDSPPKT